MQLLLKQMAHAPLPKQAMIAMATASLDLDNDGICDLTQTVGCLDSSGCNYDATATEAGYCDYPETNYDCDGNCLNDADQDGTCDAFEVDGCTDSSACNYDSDATDDDGFMHARECRLRLRR